VSPGSFDEDPLVTMKRSIVIHPFHEEDVLGLVAAAGAGSVVFGSDYPHPEGMFDPITWVDELADLPAADQAAIMAATSPSSWASTRRPRRLTRGRPAAGRPAPEVTDESPAVSEPRNGRKRSLLAQERSRDTGRRLSGPPWNCGGARLRRRHRRPTAEEIAERAGVAKATFYLHFARKDDILLETAWVTTKVFYEDALHALLGGGPVADVLDDARCASPAASRTCPGWSCGGCCAPRSPPGDRGRAGTTPSASASTAASR